MDTLDVALIQALQSNPRAGDLELSRIVQVARATVQSRLTKMEQAGIITGYGPDVNLPAAGYRVQAFVTLEIAQGALNDVEAELLGLPNVLEAYVTSGQADVMCKIAAASHEELQETLLHISKSGSVVRSTSVIVLSDLIPARHVRLLQAGAHSGARAPAFRSAEPYRSPSS